MQLTKLNHLKSKVFTGFMALAAVFALTSGQADAHCGACEVDDKKGGSHSKEAPEGAHSELHMAFKKAMKETREANTSIHEKMQELKSSMRTILTAPEFDKKAFNKKKKKYIQLKAKKMNKKREAFVNFASGLNQEQRQELANMMDARSGKAGKKCTKKKSDCKKNADCDKPGSGTK